MVFCYYLGTRSTYLGTRSTTIRPSNMDARPATLLPSVSISTLSSPIHRHWVLLPWSFSDSPMHILNFIIVTILFCHSYNEVKRFTQACLVCISGILFEFRTTQALIRRSRLPWLPASLCAPQPARSEARLGLKLSATKFYFEWRSGRNPSSRLGPLQADYRRWQAKPWPGQTLIAI